MIQYVTEKYGREQVAQIITFGTLGARAAIKDVGRVLDMQLRGRRPHHQAGPDDAAQHQARRRRASMEPRLRRAGATRIRASTRCSKVALTPGRPGAQLLACTPPAW